MEKSNIITKHILQISSINKTLLTCLNIGTPHQYLNSYILPSASHPLPDLNSNAYIFPQTLLCSKSKGVFGTVPESMQSMPTLKTGLSHYPDHHGNYTVECKNAPHITDQKLCLHVHLQTSIKAEEMGAIFTTFVSGEITIYLPFNHIKSLPPWSVILLEMLNRKWKISECKNLRTSLHLLSQIFDLQSLRCRRTDLCLGELKNTF